MAIRSPFRTLAAGLALAFAATAAWAAAPAPSPFTAKYQVLQGGQVIGMATVSLRQAGQGEWTYENRSRGTGGLAAAVGATTTETTRFRWTGSAPETLRYDYSLQAAIKNKQRHLSVDAATRQVSVDDGKGARNYAGAAGMVDRNTLPYALGLALRGGAKSFSLPVAVKQRVETQQFKVAGTEAVQVPAGSFQAQRIERTDDQGYAAWYAPQKYPLPVKLTSDESGGLTLQLVSYSQP
jgi:hypothetical protein